MAELAYLDGQLEIGIASGRKHETTKKRIAQLLEVYCDVAGIDLQAWGGTTLKQPDVVGAERAESYGLLGQEDRSDLVIEVVVRAVASTS